mgnify:CR=1 FL=1
MEYLDHPRLVRAGLVLQWVYQSEPVPATPPQLRFFFEKPAPLQGEWAPAMLTLSGDRDPNWKTLIRMEPRTNIGFQIQPGTVRTDTLAGFSFDVDVANVWDSQASHPPFVSEWLSKAYQEAVRITTELEEV